MQMLRFAVLAVASVVSTTPLFAKEGKDEPAPIREFITQHEGRFDGEKITYKVIAGDTWLRNAADEVTGSIFSFSYLKNGVRDPSSRPVIFVFNGGPGSSSVWLHMGVVGPRQLYFADDVHPPQVPPFVGSHDVRRTVGGRHVSRRQNVREEILVANDDSRMTP